MIKSYNPRPFEQYNQLPSYVNIKELYELVAQTKNGYVITLAKITVGKSVSSGNPLTHALFESFSNHGKRQISVRTRVSGCGYENSVMAVLNAMVEAGIEFDSVPVCHIEAVLTALGSCIQAQNPEIERFEILTQSCY